MLALASVPCRTTLSVVLGCLLMCACQCQSFLHIPFLFSTPLNLFSRRPPTTNFSEASACCCTLNFGSVQQLHGACSGRKLRAATRRQRTAAWGRHTAAWGCRGGGLLFVLRICQRACFHVNEHLFWYLHRYLVISLSLHMFVSLSSFSYSLLNSLEQNEKFVWRKPLESGCLIQ